MVVCRHPDGSRITELSDGTIVMSCDVAWYDPARDEGYVGDVMLRSCDDGKTWDDWTVLPPGCSESNYLELPSGVCAAPPAIRARRRAMITSAHRLRVPCRTDGRSPRAIFAAKGRYKNEAVMFSSHRGRNSTTPELITPMHAVSADAALLPDGQVVLTYDHKDKCGGPRALRALAGRRRSTS